MDSLRRWWNLVFESWPRKARTRKTSFGYPTHHATRRRFCESGEGRPVLSTIIKVSGFQNAAETNATPGIFPITRTLDPPRPMDIHLSHSGTTRPADYLPPPRLVTKPANTHPL